MHNACVLVHGLVELFYVVDPDVKKDSNLQLTLLCTLATVTVVDSNFAPGVLGVFGNGQLVIFLLAWHGSKNTQKGPPPPGGFLFGYFSFVVIFFGVASQQENATASQEENFK